VTDKPSGPPAVIVKVIRTTGRKAVRKTRRLGRTARRWVRQKWRRQLLARANPRPFALLEQAHASAGRPAEIQPRIAQEIEAHGLTLALAAVHTALELSRRFGMTDREQRGLYTAAMRAAAEIDPARAAAFGDQYLAALFDTRAATTLVKLHRSLRNYERALEIIEQMPRDEWYAANAPLLHRRGRQQRLERLFGDELRAAALAGDREVLRVAERLFAEEGDGDLVPVFRALRAVLGRAFRSNRELSRLLIRYAEKLPPLEDKDADMAGAVCEAHLHAGRIGAAADALERLAGHTPRGAARLARVTSLRRLLEEGFHYRPSLPDRAQHVPAPRRVLCMLHNSLPYNSGGYATRTHGLLSGLVRRGWDVSGVTRLGYPELFGWQDGPVDKVSRVGEVSYHRLSGALPGNPTRHEYLEAYTDALLELALAERADVLHACSNHMNGLAANAVARALGIRSVYEVRGLWEVTRISRQPDWEGSEYYKLMSRLEVQVAREADAVICITRALQDEMVRRGVPAEKITIVPNGVDVDRFVPRPRSQALAERLGLAGKKVIGYIGSIVDYEGLDLLLRAVDRLRARGASGFALLIVGDGAALEGLERLAAELRLGDLVTFTGRVPHEEVEDYYSIVDVVPLPRKSLPVTEMVSPLKPFEAMAMDKIVVASDVAALAEIVDDGVNGFLFRKDDVADLADRLEKILDPDFAHSLRPREWVVAHRSWQHLSLSVESIYEQLTGRARPGPAARDGGAAGDDDGARRWSAP
jgi:glycosyltransferase involved in cell wall biosynthesis